LQITRRENFATKADRFHHRFAVSGSASGSYCCDWILNDSFGSYFVDVPHILRLEAYRCRSSRTFLIGGPAVTALFLGIQVSIPLSLGLLGALSFVRFRTPVKDPAEIGYLLLLIAASIGAATNNYLLTTLLFVIVFIALSIQWLAGNRLTFSRRGQLMISVDQASFPDLETKLTAFLKERLRGLSLETTSVLENRVSLHYQYRQRRDFDSAAFIGDITRMAGLAKIEIFVG
jgi:hypothetical protein